MLKIKWTDRITNDEVFQRAKKERLLLKILKNRCHSWTGHTIRHKRKRKRKRRKRKRKRRRRRRRRRKTRHR